ncbi:MAG: hypothetical protein ACR2IJ_07905 [Fluviibacter sp.]
MEQIKVTTLRKAIALLEACGFQYAIIDGDGVKHGELDVPAPKPPAKRGPLVFPYGEVSEYIKKHIPDDVAVGDVLEVPIQQYGTERIRSSILNLLSRKYGRNKFTSVIDNGNVQVMRVEE